MSDEFSTILVIRIRRDVIDGATAEVSVEGDWQKDNAKLLDALRCLWQEGHKKFGWLPLGVDRTRVTFALGRGKKK